MIPGVSELPDGWEWELLGEIAETQLGKMLSAKARGGENPLPYLRNVNVQWGRIDLDDLREMDFSTREVEKFSVKRGDIVMCEGGEPGRCAIWDSDDTILFQKALHRIRPGETVHAEWLFYYFRWLGLHGGFAPFTSGIGIRHLPQEDLRIIPVPVPPLPEQQALVGRLGEIEAVCRQAQQELAEIATLLLANRRALFAIADADTFPEVALGELIERIEAGRSLPGHGRPAEVGEWGVVKVSAMTWGAFDPAENKVLVDQAAADAQNEITGGDLLISRANTTELVGASVLVPADVRRKLLLSDKSLRLVPKEAVHPHWLHAALNAPRVRAQLSAMATGTSDSMRNVSQKKLRQAVLHLPPEHKQRSIVDRLTRELQELSLLQEEIDEARSESNQLYNAILRTALEGVIRVGGTARGDSRAEDPDAEPVEAYL